jgi:hypothetical protein
MTSRTQMLNLYRDVYRFVEALRCADAAAETKSEMRFVMQMRYRHCTHHPKMRMTMAEHLRLTQLAIKGGWDGRQCVEAEERNYA